MDMRVKTQKSFRSPYSLTGDRSKRVIFRENIGAFRNETARYIRVSV